MTWSGRIQIFQCNYYYLIKNLSNKSSSLSFRFDISYHLFNLSGLFCKYFRSENIPNAEFIKNWLKAYYLEDNRLNGVKMLETEFNLLIEKELKKVFVNMLLIRMILIQRALYYEFAPDKKPNNNLIVNYCLSIYEDLIKHKEEHLKFLDN